MEPGITRVSPKRFEQQVRCIFEAGYKTLSAEAYLARKGVAREGEKECLLCFDDAYSCLAEHAFPVMESMGLTAVLFPVLDFMGKQNRWDRGLMGRRFTHMSEEDLRAALSKGFSLGFHSRTHRSLKGADLPLIEDEVLSAARELEDCFQRSVRLMAWPFGQSDRRVQMLARSWGFQMAFGVGGENNHMNVPRHMIYPTHGPKSIRAFLEGAPLDKLQRLASLGAALSARLRP